MPKARSVERGFILLIHAVIAKVAKTQLAIKPVAKTQVAACRRLANFVSAVTAAVRSSVQASLRQYRLKRRLNRDLCRQKSCAANSAALQQLHFHSSDRSFNRDLESLKVCEVAGKRTLIFHSALRCDAELFATLRDFSASSGWSLLQDRRSASVTASAAGCRDRRHSGLWLSLRWALSSAIFASAASHAAGDLQDEWQSETAGISVNQSEQNFYASRADNSTLVFSLGLFAPAPENFDSQSGAETDLSSVSGTMPDTISTEAAVFLVQAESMAKYHDVLTLLNTKWSRRKSDPAYMTEDIEQMAAYIAMRPEAYQLLSSLRDQPWSLRYRAGEYRSDVRGDALNVHSVRIYFDTRAAAVLQSNGDCRDNIGHCVASPVDALLHELLHAKLALLETAHFVRSGGMNGVVYPYQHEREVLALERQMYSAMSAHDDRPRPQRHRHRGELVTADCATCLGS